jgi:hypothetical protein
MQIELLRGSRKEPHPLISEGLNDFDASVGRSLIGDHNLDVLVGLAKNRSQACLEMTLAIEDRDYHGDEGLKTQRDP